MFAGALLGQLIAQIDSRNLQILDLLLTPTTATSFPSILGCFLFLVEEFDLVDDNRHGLVTGGAVSFVLPVEHQCPHQVSLAAVEAMGAEVAWCKVEGDAAFQVHKPQQL